MRLLAWLFHLIFSRTLTPPGTASVDLESKQQQPRQPGRKVRVAAEPRLASDTADERRRERQGPDVDTMVDYVRDALEAAARQLMAEQHIARGWDSARQRGEWLADVDAALDRYNEAVKA